MKKKCLVFGGNGFIGSHLVEDLLERNFEVKVFARFTDDKVKNLYETGHKITFIKGDFTNKKDLERAVEGVDYVFHFIYSSNPVDSATASFEKEILLNLIPTINLMDACVKYNIKKLIFPSSGGSVYGDSKIQHKNEEDHLNPITFYAINKLTIEKLLYCYWKQFGLDYIIYRISNAYGKRQSFNANQGIIPVAIKKAMQKKTINVYGNTIRDYIYVKDLTNFISNNFDKRHLYKIYNIGSGKGVRLLSLLRLIQEETGLQIKIKKLKKRKFDVDKVVLNIDRVKEEFNFNSKVGLREGIRKTYIYLKNGS